MEKVSTHYEQLVAIGISTAYASQIARGVRSPSLKLAVRIFAKTGLKFGPLLGASKNDIAAAARITSSEAA